MNYGKRSEFFNQAFFWYNGNIITKRGVTIKTIEQIQRKYRKKAKENGLTLSISNKNKTFAIKGNYMSINMEFEQMEHYLYLQENRSYTSNTNSEVLKDEQSKISDFFRTLWVELGEAYGVKLIFTNQRFSGFQQIDTHFSDFFRYSSTIMDRHLYFLNVSPQHLQTYYAYHKALNDSLSIYKNEKDLTLDTNRMKEHSSVLYQVYKNGVWSVFELIDDKTEFSLRHNDQIYHLSDVSELSTLVISLLEKIKNKQSLKTIMTPVFHHTNTLFSFLGELPRQEVIRALRATFGDEEVEVHSATLRSNDKTMNRFRSDHYSLHLFLFLNKHVVCTSNKVRIFDTFEEAKECFLNTEAELLRHDTNNRMMDYKRLSE